MIKAIVSKFNVNLKSVKPFTWNECYDFVFALKGRKGVPIYAKIVRTKICLPQTMVLYMDINEKGSINAKFGFKLYAL